MLARARDGAGGACLRVLRGPRAGERLLLPVARQAWLLGRAADCDLRLEGAGVSRHHARLRRAWPGFVLSTSSAKNGVWLEGRRVEGEASVVDGDRIAIGPIVVQLVDPGSAARLAFDAAAEREPPVAETASNPGSTGPAAPHGAPVVGVELAPEPDAELSSELDPDLLEPAESTRLAEWLTLTAGLAATGVLGAAALWLLT